MSKALDYLIRFEFLFRAFILDLISLVLKVKLKDTIIF